MKNRFHCFHFTVLLLAFQLAWSGIENSAAGPAVIFELLALNRDLPTPQKPKYRSPTDLVPSVDSTILFIAQQTAKRIDIFDIAAGTVTGRILLPNEVTGIARSPNSNRLYATCSSDWWPAGQVCVIDVAANAVTAIIPVGYGARAPVVSPDGTKLYVCNRFDNDVSVIDMSAGRELRRVKAVREPYCAAVTPDGKTLVVGNYLHDDRATDSIFVSCKVSLINTENSDDNVDIRLTRGSTSITGIAVSPDGSYAFATHTIEKFNMIGTTVERGWLTTNNLAVIDLKTKSFVNDVCLDLSYTGLANPWAVKCTDDGEFIVVAHAGSNELSMIRLAELMDSVLVQTERGDDMQRDFIALLNSRKKVAVNTRGPRSLAIIGKTALTAGYFDDEQARLEGFEITLDASQAVQTYTIGEKQPWTGERHGESNFYNASLSFQKWISCQSCHPHTRASGYNHILGGGAIVAPKSNKNLLYSWWTPPTTWTGRRGDARQAIIAGIELELFRAAVDSLSLPLDTFFMSLKPVPSPKLVKGRLSDAARHGKAVFFSEKAGCSTCHTPPLYTDMQFHDAIVPDPFDANTNWDTPSLIETWRSGPYSHLGNYSDIREMIELESHSNALQNLSTNEIDDLVEYVLSL